MPKKRKSPHLNIGAGLKIPVVSEVEGNACDYLICARADQDSPFKDNLHEFCCKCGVKVMYRSHAPLKPKRICVECVDEILPPKAG